MDLQDVRDLVIVIFGAAGLLFLLVLTYVVLRVWASVRELTREVQRAHDDYVAPTVRDLRRSAATLRGAGSFMREHGLKQVRGSWQVARTLRRASKFLP